MAKVFIEETSLIAIGDAIREKTGSTATMSPAEMITAIENIVTTGGETVIGDVGMVGLTYKTTSNLVNTYDVSTYNTKHCFVITKTDYSSGSRYITEVEDGVTKQYYSIGNSDGRLYEYNGSDTSSANPRYCPTVTIDEAGIMTVTSQSYKLGYYAILFYSTGSGEAGGGIVPEGELAITENGSYDVTEYASAAVNVPVGITPTGTFDITDNGIFNISEYENVNVNVAASGGGSTDYEDITLGYVKGSYNSPKLTDYTNNRISTLRNNAFRGMGLNGTFTFKNLVEIETYAFADSEGEFALNAPELITCASYCFYNSPITSITADNVRSLGGSDFYNAKKLVEISLPSLTTLNGGNNFRNCTSLKKVDIGGAISTIMGRAFADCPALETLIIRRSDILVSLMASNTFDNSSIAAGTGYIYVPRQFLANYKAATNWSTYAAQIRAIEDYPEICG